MGGKTMVWLEIASILVITGLVLFAVVMVAVGGKFSALGTGKYVSNTHEIREDFRNVRLEVDTANIVFALSEDGVCKVVCYEEEKAQHSVTVSDDTLQIKVQNEKAWYDYIQINFVSPKITVYLPEAEYLRLAIHADTGDVEIPGDFRFEEVDVAVSTGDVTCRASAAGQVAIKTSTGHIRVENIQVGALSLTASTGRILVSGVTCQGDVTLEVDTGKNTLTDLRCNHLTSIGQTGDLIMKNVVAEGNFSIWRSTGDVTFDACDAAAIMVETDTGNVTGSFCSGKNFSASADTGRVQIPDNTQGGPCKIQTSTGNIKLWIV